VNRNPRKEVLKANVVALSIVIDIFM